MLPLLTIPILCLQSPSLKATAPLGYCECARVERLDGTAKVKTHDGPKTLTRANKGFSLRRGDVITLLAGTATIRYTNQEKAELKVKQPYAINKRISQRSLWAMQALSDDLEKADRRKGQVEGPLVILKPIPAAFVLRIVKHFPNAESLIVNPGVPSEERYQAPWDGWNREPLLSRRFSIEDKAAGDLFIGYVMDARTDEKFAKAYRAAQMTVDPLERVLALVKVCAGYRLYDFALGEIEAGLRFDGGNAALLRMRNGLRDKKYTAL